MEKSDNNPQDVAKEMVIENNQSTEQTKISGSLMTRREVCAAIGGAVALILTGCPPKYKDFEMTEDAGVQQANQPAPILAPHAKPTLTNLHESLKKENPNAVVDKNTGNVICSGAETMLKEPLIEFEIRGQKFKLKKTAAEALQKANQQLAEKSNNTQYIIIKSALRTNEEQNIRYLGRQAREIEFTAQPGFSAFERGQAVEVTNYVAARGFLIANGFLDAEKGNYTQFEFKNSFTDADRKASDYNLKCYYGTEEGKKWCDAKQKAAKGAKSAWEKGKDVAKKGKEKAKGWWTKKWEDHCRKRPKALGCGKKKKK